MKKQDIKTAISIGRFLQENGAEIYRVEDTIKRLISTKISEEVSVFAIPTGIIVSVGDNEETYTILDRVDKIKIDLEAIDNANALSRKLIKGEITFKKGREELKKMQDAPRYSFFVRLVGASIGGGFWTLLFGAGKIDFVLAVIGSGINALAFEYLSKKEYNFFIRHIIGGFMAGMLGVLLVDIASIFKVTANLDLVIVGPLMTLVPGVAVTNGMRDVISGELVSGGAKITEAIFIAIALAFGVGVVLQIVVNRLI